MEFEGSNPSGVTIPTWWYNWGGRDLRVSQTLLWTLWFVSERMNSPLNFYGTCKLSHSFTMIQRTRWRNFQLISGDRLSDSNAWERNWGVTTRVYRFGNYLIKNKLYRVDMDLFIKLPLMECVPVCGFCGKAVYKNGKVNKLPLTGWTNVPAPAGWKWGLRMCGYRRP